MDKAQVDEAIRRIAAAARNTDASEWEVATELARFSAVEYEQALPRIIEATGWTRMRLTALRTTAGQWTPEKRLPDVPFVMHQRFRYEPEELIRQHNTGTLGQPTRATQRQHWTLSQMQGAITSILDLEDSTSSYEERWHKTMAILALWRVKVTA